MQIDYLIQTKFNVLYVCEIKLHSRPVGKEIIREMEKKIKNLVTPKGYSKAPVLIHVNGVSEEVVNSGYFAEIINFGDLLHGGDAA